MLMLIWTVTIFRSPSPNPDSSSNQFNFSIERVEEPPQMSDLRMRLKPKPLPLTNTNIASSIPKLTVTPQVLNATYRIPRRHSYNPALYEPSPTTQQPTFNISGLSQMFSNISNGGARNVPATQPESAHKPHLANHRAMINMLFGHPCYRYLNGHCTETNCNYRHNLVDAQVVKRKLSSYSLGFTEAAYSRFVQRSKLCFEKYFKVFCQRFADFKASQKLLELALDITAFEPPFVSFYCHVAEALVACGYSRPDAIKSIFASVQLRTFDVLNVLVDMMVATDCFYFVTELNTICCIADYQFNSNHVCHMLDVTLATKNQQLVGVLVSILKKMPNADRSIGEDRLSQFFLFFNDCVNGNASL